MREMTCIVCPLGCLLRIRQEGQDLAISGNQCPRGISYAQLELSDPKRNVTTILSVFNSSQKTVAVKTAKPISKKLIFPLIQEIKKLKLQAPICIGDVLIKSVLATDVDVLASSNAPEK